MVREGLLIESFCSHFLPTWPQSTNEPVPFLTGFGYESKQTRNSSVSSYMQVSQARLYLM